MSTRLMAIVASALLLAACGALTESFTLTDGSTHDGDVSLVNGRIDIGENCEVEGSVQSVNGSVRVGRGSRIQGAENVNGSIGLGEDVQVGGDIETVNGRVVVGAGSRVSGSVETVNGSISIEQGAEITDAVESVNGRIELIGARTASVTTLNGSITLDEGAVVSGGLTVRKNSGFNLSGGSVPRVVVGRDVEVGGPLVFEREVELYVHESATVGEITGAEPTSYSGESP